MRDADRQFSDSPSEIVLAKRDGSELPRTHLVANQQPAEATNKAKSNGKPTYVGKEVCRECHAENFELHRVHGHAHTFHDANSPHIAKHYDGMSYDHGAYGEYKYSSDDDQLSATLPARFGDQAFPLQFALGSGHNGITLLSLMSDENNETVAFEHRVSWFHENDLLGPTPGQRDEPPKSPGDLFGQRHVGNVMRKCVYCHTTTGEIVDQEIVNLTPNVNCEKCHGPGSEHVQQARTMKTPPPFSVGASSWDAESEIQLCGDCHRLPTNVSRKELREYPDSLTRFQPIGMLRSECFLSSSGELKCTTCHNPHETLSKMTTQQYVERCIECHLENSESHVACPVSPRTGCIECHMPPVRLEEAKASFHDHWIRIREE
jgi:predicted CXXCH cytochrome family protein